MTGDVFAGVEIPGVGEHELLMVISHPCTMRRGPDLQPKMQAVPVVEYQQVPFERWVDGHVRVMPLPRLLSDEPDRPMAARLSEFGMVQTAELGLQARRACLSELGVALTLQRFFYCLSRVHVKVKTIATSAQANMEEAELQEEWNEVIGSARVERGDQLDVVLREETQALYDVLEQPGPRPDTKLRDGLAEPAERAGVRRLVANARAQRVAELDV
jgi:hypothetical protein